MTNLSSRLCWFFKTALGVAGWQAIEQSASAQTLLAQTGTTKTLIGWLIVLLCIGLGLLVVCRPSGRQMNDKRR